MRRWSRPLLVPAAVGCLLLAVATSACSTSGDDEASTGDTGSDTSSNASGPRANQDHWHSSFDVYVCDEFLGPVADQGPDIDGLHTHQDGLIHIHPFVDSASGENATFGKFAELVGIVVEDGVFGMPMPTDPDDVREIRPSDETVPPSFVKRLDGDACPGGPGRVALFVWGPGEGEGDEPTVITDDIGATRFTADGQRFVLAFVPEDVVPPQPPSTRSLAQPGDMS